ncbi:hypothetical protein VFPPC_07424 [Pochonia chlamydosporia 170]|uniref:Uncharacterized protein n=1 Tax=Pochonia chlamydosporia 170 TaxID=1380566 RepID=A0A179F8Z0_METCM|nr:hypothetical protein VFPPC_07424 [Pochonia chlamydosporia 170]OAQ61847.1 hypothetical protein VFPPC_07424 [Pochonia chlamydosporia 170]
MPGSSKVVRHRAVRCSGNATFASSSGSLRDQLPTLELQKSQHSLLSEGVRFLELECLGIRQGSINLSASLLKDRDVLASARAKIDGVASNLRSVEYVRIRRQITGTLRDIMQDLGAASSSGVGDKKVLARAVVIVRQIEMNTPKCSRY